MLQNRVEKLSGTAINTYVRGVKSFWSFLKREEIIQDDPLAGVPAPKIPTTLPKILTEDELNAVFQVSMIFRDRVILEVFLDSGMRLSELAELNKVDVDTESGVIKVQGKGEKERHVFVSNKTAIKIKAYILFERPEPMAEDNLFLTIDGYPLNTKRIQKILERIGGKAGISQRLSPHKLRHSYATLSLKYGSNLEYLRRSLGHSSTKTTGIYLSVADADIAEAHRQFSPVTNLRLGKVKGKDRVR
jgi:site-specific recombinase XerD